MEAGYVPNLRKDRPNMGSMMKKLGYRTAFYGKWEMDLDIIPPKPTVNSSESLQPVNRHPILTHDRRPILTHLSDESGR